MKPAARKPEKPITVGMVKCSSKKGRTVTMARATP
tara:strand:- start:145 stop:249 length:105 start_codon:yes stop_codon:yes gene_type:complete